MSHLIWIYTIWDSVLDFKLKPLLNSMDMSKFKNGRVHFRNSGMKGLTVRASNLSISRHLKKIFHNFLSQIGWHFMWKSLLIFFFLLKIGIFHVNNLLGWFTRNVISYFTPKKKKISIILFASLMIGILRLNIWCQFTFGIVFFTKLASFVSHSSR